MAKCYNCGKNFDYDKYYGICPKCSAYNREKLPEEEHQELHEAYDQNTECSNLNGQEFHEMPRDPYGYVPLDTRPKSSTGSAILLVFLILGIVAAIGTPLVYLVGRSMKLGMKLVNDASEIAGNWNDYGFQYPEDDWASLDEYEDEYPMPEVEQPRQSVETITKGIQEACEFGNGLMTVTVTDQAYIKVPAGQMEGFPEGENLVAVPVSYLNENTEYQDYNALGMIYVGFGEQIFRSTLSSYELDDYGEELGLYELPMDMIGGEGEGVLLVFMPEEITEFSLYLESRDEDTNQMLGLYEIPLEIRSEAAAEDQEEEAE